MKIQWSLKIRELQNLNSKLLSSSHHSATGRPKSVRETNRWRDVKWRSFIFIHVRLQLGKLNFNWSLKLARNVHFSSWMRRCIWAFSLRVSNWESLKLGDLHTAASLGYGELPKGAQTTTCFVLVVTCLIFLRFYLNFMYFHVISWQRIL